MSESEYDCEVVGERMEGAEATYWFLQVRVGPDAEMLYGVYDSEDDPDGAVTEAWAERTYGHCPYDLIPCSHAEVEG